MSTLLSVSIALLVGLLMTRAFKPLKLPSVTAYLIAGVTTIAMLGGFIAWLNKSHNS